MDIHPQNDWDSIRYDPRFDEYWVPAGGAIQLLFFCPWCGESLPASQRDRWFDELEAQGLDPLEDEVPEAYRSGAWRGVPDKQADRGRDQRSAIEGRVLNFFDTHETGTDEA